MARRRDVPLRSFFQKGFTAQLQGVWLGDSFLQGLLHLLSQGHNVPSANSKRWLSKMVAKVTLFLGQPFVNERARQWYKSLAISAQCETPWMGNLCSTAPGWPGGGFVRQHYGPMTPSAQSYLLPLPFTGVTSLYSSVLPTPSQSSQMLAQMVLNFTEFLWRINETMGGKTVHSFWHMRSSQ